jgi:hypothetical protein
VIRPSAFRPAAVALAALALACDRVPSGAITSCDTRVDIAAVKTDILFVVDDSGSMGEEQGYLKQNLDAFITLLKNAPVQFDFQVGVTNTSVRDFSGATAYPVGAPSASVPYPAGRLLAIDSRALTDDAFAGTLLYDPTADGGAGAFTGHRILPSSSATLVADFMANVRVGTWGSGKEQPFRAATQALTTWASDPFANQGFLRDGARLVVVFLTDEDDCSETNGDLVSTNDACHDPLNKADATTQLDRVSDFASFLTTTLAARAPIVGIIAGVDPTTKLPAMCRKMCPLPNDTQVCAEAFDRADRLRRLYDLLPVRQRYIDSICNLDYGPALTGIADLLVPQTVALDGTPPDWRMLSVGMTRSDGTFVPCHVALAGSPEAADPTTDVVFTPASGTQAATLTFQNECQLHISDSVNVQLVCAG